jgi:hypothetical protein
MASEPPVSVTPSSQWRRIFRNVGPVLMTFLASYRDFGAVSTFWNVVLQSKTAGFIDRGAGDARKRPPGTEKSCYSPSYGAVCNRVWKDGLIARQDAAERSTPLLLFCNAARKGTTLGTVADKNGSIF